jgi:hypothetical protein
VKRVWMQTLVELGVTNKALIEHGLRSARASGWVRLPSAGQFCNWAWDAAQKSAGIPTLAEAQAIIIHRLGRPTMRLSGAMNHISLELNWFELRRASGQRVNDLVASSYEKMIAHWKHGLPFREHVKNDMQAIEDNSYIARPLTQKQRDEAKSNMQLILGAL